MAVYETQDSRPFDVSDTSETVTRRYYVSDANTEDEAYEAARAYAPLKLGSKNRSRISGQPIAVGLWFVDVEWSTVDSTRAVGAGEPPAPSAPGLGDSLDSSYTIDTTGAQVHITKANYTRFKRQAGDEQFGPNFNGSAPDPKLAIGLTKDRVEGTDIYAPAFTFTKTVQRANVSMQYINNALYGLVGTINRKRFYQFAEGEVLYLGCTGNFTRNERWTLTHKFACSPNEEGIDIGNGIVVPKKFGWEYLWVGYEPQQVGDLILQQPVAAYVQGVYRGGDFALLDIGEA